MALVKDNTRVKKTNNQLISLSNTKQLIDYLNRVIHTQNHLFEANFNLKNFLNFVVKEIQNLTNANGVAIELIEEDKTIYAYTFGSLKKYKGLTSNLHNSLSALSINTHQIIRIDNTKEDIRINKKNIRAIGYPNSLITVPLFHLEKVIGSIIVVANKTDYFNDSAVQGLKIMASLAGFGIFQQFAQEELKKLYKNQNKLQTTLKNTEIKLKHATHHDYLTDLANRNLFNEQLYIAMTKAKRKKQMLALMYLDIDNFKSFNEKLGHSLADKLLYAFAMRLKQSIRTSDIIARLGGDEFIILIDDINEVQDVIVIIDKIFQTIRKPFNLNKKLFNLTASIGVAFFNDQTISPDEFIRQADQALYISKNSGRNTFYIFNSELLHEMTQQVP